MADLTPIIETMENRFMRAWVQRDAKALKAHTGRSFILLTGSKPAAILDKRSWVDAATTRWTCTGYRFAEIYVREVGGLALFATQAELKTRMDGQDWSGTYWLTDLWKKGRIRRRWTMVHRTLSRVDDNAHVAAAIRSLQLWRPMSERT